MSITRKAFLIISLPILFQAGFVLLLLQMERRADDYRVWQTHSSETSMATYRLLGLVLDAESASEDYGNTGNPAFLDSYQRTVVQIPRELDRLRTLSSIEESERLEIPLPDRYRVSGLERTLNPLLTKFDEENQLVAAERGAVAAARFEGRKGPTLMDLFREQVSGFLGEEIAVQQLQQRDWERSQNNLHKTVTAGAAFNMLITIGLLSFLLRSMKGRLGRLLQNTNRLARGEELHALGEGRDEIARLDASFHAMAGQLRQTQEALRREMSELGEAQRALTEQKGRLEELNAEKNRFIGMAAHDLRNPLFAVSTFADVLTRQEPLSSRQLAAVQKIQATVRSMTRLVEDFLDASTIESGTLRLQLADCDLVAIARDCVALLRPSAEQKGITVRLEAESAAWVVIDGDKIAQVVTNLLSNALKFSLPGSSVSIAVMCNAQQIELAVGDEGAGISEQELHLLFRPFSMTTNGATAGESRTGLGLAICRRIIEEHGGTISVQSKAGVGSTFRFVLPIEPLPSLQPS